MHRLTAVQVRPLARPGRYCDGGGLWLQVSPSLTKSWVVRYDLNGVRHEVGLGALRDVPLAAARDKALSLRQQLRTGINPLMARRAAAEEERM